MRLRLCCVLLSAVLVARAQTLGNNPHATGVEGTYELVSQETRLTKPQKSVIMRKSPDWSGLLQFHDGYYAWVLMKKTRPPTLNLISQKISGLRRQQAHMRPET